MSRYRKVLSRIWEDDKFPYFSKDAQLVFLYHLTSPRSTPFLLYVEGPGSISDALRMPSPRLREAMDEVTTSGMVWYADDGSNLLFLPRAMRCKENAPESLNAVKMWLSLLKDIPKTPFYYKCLRHWEGMKHDIGHAFTLAFMKACITPSLISEQEQEQEQEVEEGANGRPPSSPAGDAPPTPYQVADIIAQWNAVKGVKTVDLKRLTPGRGTHKRISTLLRNHDNAWWAQLWEQVNKQLPFLFSGENPMHWVAELPWLLGPENLAKVLEGRYVGWKPKSALVPPAPVATIAAVQKSPHCNWHPDSVRCDLPVTDRIGDRYRCPWHAFLDRGNRPFGTFEIFNEYLSRKRHPLIKGTVEELWDRANRGLQPAAKEAM